MDWELYGPDDTAKPEPTQHALERAREIWPSQSYLFAPTASNADRREYNAAAGDVRFLTFEVPERLWNVPPGHYTAEADEVISTETAEALERRAEEMLRRASAIREKYARFGEDDFPDGAVIIFDKRFNEYQGRPIPWSKPYHYAAIKAAGLWSTTGPKSPKSYTWTELVRWMGDGVEEIYYASQMEKFVG